MSGNKSPRSYGYSSEFCKAAWSIVSADFIIVVQSFFHNDFLPKGVNATIIALIPKTTDAKVMKDYPPISC